MGLLLPLAKGVSEASGSYPRRGAVRGGLQNRVWDFTSRTTLSRCLASWAQEGNARDDKVWILGGFENLAGISLLFYLLKQEPSPTHLICSQRDACPLRRVSSPPMPSASCSQGHCGFRHRSPRSCVCIPTPGHRASLAVLPALTLASSPRSFPEFPTAEPPVPTPSARSFHIL